MLESARLALQFDCNRLRADLARLSSGVWTAHFNKSYFDGDWSGIVLRGSATNQGLFPGRPDASQEFASTEALDACPYFQEVLATFQCPLKSVRLLRLAAGSIIREHTDSELGEDNLAVRLHIPVATNPQVEFYLAGKRVAMNAGECWYLDLSLPHRVQNLGTTDRIHMVIDCALNDWLRHLIRSPLPEREVEQGGAAALGRFAQIVFDDPDLQAVLRDIPELEEFVRATVRHGEARGFHFTPEDVRTAWRAGRSASARTGRRT